MSTDKREKKVIKDVPVNVKLKLSALWAVLMLIYIYVDIFNFFQPGALQAILEGRVWVLEITQGWALISLILMLIPTLMVFLSLALKAPASRWTNIVVAILYILVGIGTMIGETWAYYIVGHTTGIIILLLVLMYAWKWPVQD